MGGIELPVGGTSSESVESELGPAEPESDGEDGAGKDTFDRGHVHGHHGHGHHNHGGHGHHGHVHGQITLPGIQPHRDAGHGHHLGGGAESNSPQNHEGGRSEIGVYTRRIDRCN